MRHFHETLNDLKQKLLKMGFLAEEAVGKSIEALLRRRRDWAEQVFSGEKIINQMEIEIDDEGHSLLALGQPMAADLRLITAMLKINTDLERMGDHAVNIAERAILLIGEPPIEKIVDLPEMSLIVRKMLRDSLSSFVHNNLELAEAVLRSDDKVDAYNNALNRELQKLMEKNPSVNKAGILLLRVSHDLERIADLANNIAEDVIYLKQGKEVRHHLQGNL